MYDAPSVSLSVPPRLRQCDQAQLSRAVQAVESLQSAVQAEIMTQSRANS